jgi:predicted signal transduction protein with EAL and GGDEF domain
MGQQVFVNASIGIAMGLGGEQSATELLRNADRRDVPGPAAARGGQREIFAPAMHAELLVRMQMESDLRSALGKGEFELDFRPIATIGTGDIDAFEAQLRWHHPVHGSVPAAQFGPLAEETGSIVPIGRWAWNGPASRPRRGRLRGPADRRPPCTWTCRWRQLRQPGLPVEVARDPWLDRTWHRSAWCSASPSR